MNLGTFGVALLAGLGHVERDGAYKDDVLLFGCRIEEVAGVRVLVIFSGTRRRFSSLSCLDAEIWCSPTRTVEDQ